MTWSKVMTNHEIVQQLGILVRWNTGGHTTVQMMKTTKTLMAPVGILLPLPAPPLAI
jgi:hypothetical protein